MANDGVRSDMMRPDSMWHPAAVSADAHLPEAVRAFKQRHSHLAGAGLRAIELGDADGEPYLLAKVDRGFRRRSLDGFPPPSDAAAVARYALNWAMGMDANSTASRGRRGISLPVDCAKCLRAPRRLQ
jgi:hypothetical protein